MKKKTSHFEEPQTSINRKFVKDQKKQIQKAQSITETIQTWWTNAKYKISSAFNSDNQKPQQIKDITILGAKYKNKKQAKQALQKVFWFTYRNKLNIKNQYSSDVGWGCLVRVGQMAIASGLQRYLKKNGQFEYGKAQQLNIIYACIDQEGKYQKYSLNKFVGQAQKHLNHKIGQWFDLSKICYMLSKLQNKNPMKGTQGLKVVYFDQILSIKTILSIEEIPWCKCTKPRIKCDKCYHNLAAQTKYSISYQNTSYESTNYSDKGGFQTKSSNKAYSCNLNQEKGKLSLATKTVNFMDPFFKKKMFKDLMIIIVTQASFGQNAQQAQALNNAIFTLLDLDSSLGILTGFPKKAIYVIGRQEQELIYLDPHLVQKSVSKNLQNGDMESFFCKDYNKTRVQKLDPSMAFCFYLRNLNDLDNLYKAIQNVNLYFKGRLSIGCDWKYCSYQEEQFTQDSDDRLSQMSFFTP